MRDRRAKFDHESSGFGPIFATPDSSLRGSAPRIPSATEGAVGIECEYWFYEDGLQRDFGQYIGPLVEMTALPLRCESPTQFRMPDGHVLSADGWYIEMATPPEPLRPHTPRELAADVIQSRNWLIEWLEACSARVGRQYRLNGYSTHLNLQTEPGRQERLAHAFALRYSPLFLYLTCLPDTRAMMVRPRPGRLELAHRELPRLPHWNLGPAARRARARAGRKVRRGDSGRADRGAARL
jgi:hypothetical protein